MEADNKFPSMLKDMLKQKNITQTELARSIGVKPNTISNYRNGVSQPDADTIIKIASFFDVSIDYLLTGKRTENKITREELGLSERALQILKQIAHDETHAMLSQFINMLICDEGFRTTYEKTCSELMRKARDYPAMKRLYEDEGNTLALVDYMRFIELDATIEMHEFFQRYFERVNTWRFIYDEKK